MIKVFTVDKDGKIKLTKDQLEKMLNEAYNDGYHDAYFTIANNKQDAIFLKEDRYKDFINTISCSYSAPHFGDECTSAGK